MKKNLFSSRNLFAITSLLMAGLLFTACKKSVNGDSNVPVAGLMAFNLSPDKSVTVAISGNSLTNLPLSYTSYTGDYLAIYPGNRTVESYDYTTGSSIASAPFEFEQKKYYSAFVTGANGNYRNVVVNDNFDSLSASSGQAYIRYINAIPDSSQPAVTISANGSNVISNNAAFASVSDFAAATPGQVSINVSNGGTINVSRTITLEQKKVYTVLLLGIPGSTASSDSIQIRYITNGTLDDIGQKTAVAAHSVSIN
jgi:uncharacterized protein DUF4397